MGLLSFVKEAGEKLFGMGVAKVIFEANKSMLSHPDKIYPGQMLRIPPLG